MNRPPAPLLFTLALCYAITGLGYVRREFIPRRPTQVSVGSRDRTLPGKARRQARRSQ